MGGKIDYSNTFVTILEKFDSVGIDILEYIFVNYDVQLYNIVHFTPQARISRFGNSAT